MCLNVQDVFQHSLVSDLFAVFTQHENLSCTEFSSHTNFYVVKMLTCVG